MDGTMVLSRVQFLTTDGGIIKRSQVSKAFIPLRKASRTTRKGIDDWTLSSSAYIPYPKVEHPKMRGGNATALSLGSLGIYTKIFNSVRCVRHSCGSHWVKVHGHQPAYLALHLQRPKCQTNVCSAQAAKGDMEAVYLQAWRLCVKI